MSVTFLTNEDKTELEQNLSNKISSSERTLTLAIATETEERKAEIAIDRARITNLAILQEGSTTGDAELADIRVGYDGYTHANAGEAVRSQVGTVEKRFKSMSDNLINQDRLTPGKYNSYNYYGDSTTYGITEMIAVKPNTPYYYTSQNTVNMTYEHSQNRARFVTFYDANMTYLSYISSDCKEFTTPENCAYLQLTYYVNVPYPMLFEGARDTSVLSYNYHLHGKEINTPVDGALLRDRTVPISGLGVDIIIAGKNKFNKSAVSVGFLNADPASLDTGSIALNYSTSEFIPVKAGQPYTISPKCRQYALYNQTKDIVARDQTDVQAARTITPEQDGYLRVSVLNTILDTVQIEEGNEATAFEPFVHVLADNITLSEKQKKSIGTGMGNVLYGKKWVACGDSFTEGIAAGKFTEGKFINQYKSYPFLIGERNNMDIVNLAVGGMTMAARADSTNYFSGTVYKNIPADADYITIKLGINDGNFDSPVGTINDTDNTTFYGAWNVVLEHIIVNHPLAKIGIIVTNGSSLEYVNATIAIAEKWGIPYLNEATGVLVPTMHRSNKALPASVIEARLNAFAADRANGDTHPNAAGHEYESTFVENFLRTL